MPAREDVSATDTKDRLLDAGERLFAEKGLRATTVRDIAAAAGANVAAVNYHFRGKEGLTRAVLMRRVGPLNAQRLAALDAAEAGGAPALEDVLRAFIAPTMQQVQENPAFMRIMGRFHTEPDEDLRAWFLGEMGEIVVRFKAALERALPGRPLGEVFWRMHFLMGAMIHTWTCAQDLAAVSDGLCRADEPADRLIDRLVTFGAAGLRAPVGGGAS